MTTSRAEAGFQRALADFKSPTLNLLHGRYAPFVVAMLNLVFTADRPTVAIADAHTEIGDAAEELRAAGYDEETERTLPAGNGRDICRYWVRVGWLVQQIEDGNEVYRLSAQAVGALEIAGRAGGGRSRISGSRVRTLLDAVEHLTNSAEPDEEQRRAALLAERAAIDELLRQAETQGFEPIEDDQLLEEAENVLHLSRELPADFARVAESINQMQRAVVAELRQDVRPAGDVLREYLHRGQHVMEATPEGRAFAGALRLIGDPEQIDQLTHQLHGLLAQPFTRHLDRQQRADLNAIAKRVEQGVNEVLAAQRGASHIITAQVRTHDPARDREVDELLRNVMSGLHAWMRVSGPADKVEPLRRFPTADVGNLRQSLSDPQPPGTPAPLRLAVNEAQFDDGDARAWGGPDYPALEEYVAGLGEGYDLAEAFEGAAALTRRPVDLLGLLEITHRHGMSEGERISVVETVRPDGTKRRFAFGSVTGSGAGNAAPQTGQSATEQQHEEPQHD